MCKKWKDNKKSKTKHSIEGFEVNDNDCSQITDKMQNIDNTINLSNKVFD